MKQVGDFENVFFDTSSRWPYNDFHRSPTGQFEYIKLLFDQVSSQMGTNFFQFQFYLLFSQDVNVIPESTLIKHPRKILFWFSEESGSFPEHLQTDYLFIFKSYIKEEKNNVFSNHLGFVNKFLNSPTLNQDFAVKYSVFFSGYLNENRLELFCGLLQWRYPILSVFPNSLLFRISRRFKKIKIYFPHSKMLFYFSNAWASGINISQYIEYVKSSRFILCPRGFQSVETFRHIEANYLGRGVISEKMPNVGIYEEFNYLSYTNVVDLINILKSVDFNNQEFSSDKSLSINTFSEKVYCVLTNLGTC